MGLDKMFKDKGNQNEGRGGGVNRNRKGELRR